MKKNKERTSATSLLWPFKSTVIGCMGLLALLLLANACKEIDPKNCAQAVCSDQFNRIYMEVKYSDDTPMALDTFKLVNMLDKSTITLNFSNTDFQEMQTTGKYLIFDDSYVQQFQNAQLVIEFTGTRNDTILKNAITVDVDCCHVSPYYGSLTIVVPKQ